MREAFIGRRFAPEKFNAVDWRTLNDEQRARLYSLELNAKTYFKPLTAGECGCYASHVGIWQTLIESGEPWALVLEDDTEPMPLFDEVIAALIQWPADWDMIKLVGRDSERVSQRISLLAGHDIVRYSRAPSLTGAYLVSAAGARKLLKSRVPFGRPVDIDIRWWWEPSLDLYGVLPYPVRSAESSRQSSIGQRGASSRGLVTKLRKVKFNISYHLGNFWHTRSR